MTQGLQFSLLFSGLESLSAGDAGFAKPGQSDAAAQQAAAFQQLLDDEQYIKDLRQGQTIAAAIPPKNAALTSERQGISGNPSAGAYRDKPQSEPAIVVKDGSVTAYTDPAFYTEQGLESTDIDADFAGKWLGLIQQSSDANTHVTQKGVMGSHLHDLQDEPLIDKLGPVPDDDTSPQALQFPLLSEETIQGGVSLPAVARQGQADTTTTSASATVILTEATGESSTKAAQPGTSAISAAALINSSDTIVNLSTVAVSSNLANTEPDDAQFRQGRNSLASDSSLGNVTDLSHVAANQNAERQVIDKASQTTAVSETMSADIRAVENAAELLMSESRTSNTSLVGAAVADAQTSQLSMRGDASGQQNHADKQASPSASMLLASSNHIANHDVSRAEQDVTSASAAIATDNVLEQLVSQLDTVSATKTTQAQPVTTATTSAPAITTLASAPLSDATDAVATAVSAAETIVATGLGLSTPQERTGAMTKASASQKRGLDTLGSGNERVTDNVAKGVREMASSAAITASDITSNNEQHGQARQDSKTLTFTKFEVALAQNGSQTAAATVNSPSTPTTEAAVSLVRAEGFASVLEQPSRPQSAAVAPSLAAQLKQLNLQQQDAAGQLRERVQLMVRQNVQVAEIRLDPAELGQMQIRVNLQQEQATVQFIVQQQQAKELLEQQMPKLREMLQQQGIQLGEGQVQQQARQDRQERQSTEQHGGRSASSGDDTPGAAESGASNSTLEIHHSERLVDYYA